MAFKWIDFAGKTSFTQAADAAEKDAQRLHHGSELATALDAAKKDQERLYKQARAEQQAQAEQQVVATFYNTQLPGVSGFANTTGLHNQYLYNTTTSSIVPVANGQVTFTMGGVVAEPLVRQSQIDELKNMEPRTAHRPAPDSITMMTGWRAWRITHDAFSGELRLKAVGQDTIWEPKKKMEARCTAVGSISLADPAGIYGTLHHAAPKRDCTCGFWSFKTVDMLPEALLGQFGQSAVVVIGSVDLWGRVIETENGFRAQYAYPKELWLLRDGLEELGWIYGVKIRSRSPGSRVIG